MKMVNTEKIINSLKRKFSKRSEFEERKIVFWYDSDQVVWDILENRLTDDMESIIDELKKIISSSLELITTISK